MVGLLGEQSGTLQGIAAAVHSHGLVNARGADMYHVTLGRVERLPDPQGQFAYPPDGAAVERLPDLLAESLCRASWSLVVVKLRDGKTPAQDGEREQI